LKRLKLGPRGSQHKHTPLLTLRLNFNENNGDLSGKKRMGFLREGQHLNKGGPKVKQLLGLVCATNVPFETPPNCQKKTFVIES
jgi:hypothetical protein